MLKGTSKPGTPGETRHPALSSPKALLEYLTGLSSARIKTPQTLNRNKDPVRPKTQGALEPPATRHLALGNTT